MHTGWLFLGLSVACYGVWSVLAKIAQQQGAAPLWLTFLTAVGTGIVALAICLPQTDWAAVRQTRAALAPGLLAGLAVGVGNICFYKSLQSVPVSIAYPISSLSILVSVLLAVTLLRETLTVSQGAGVLLAGVALILLSR